MQKLPLAKTLSLVPLVLLQFEIFSTFPHLTSSFFFFQIIRFQRYIGT